MYFSFSALMAVVAFVTLIVLLPVGHSRWMSWKPGDTGKMTVNSLRQTFRTGAFTEPVNKLDCAGVIINIPTVQYDEYIRQWGLYKRAGNSF
jgi:hypothetical protein